MTEQDKSLERVWNKIGFHSEQCMVCGRDDHLIHAPVVAFTACPDHEEDSLSEQIRIVKEYNANGREPILAAGKEECDEKDSREAASTESLACEQETLDGLRKDAATKELTDGEALEWLKGLKERGYYFQCSVDGANSEVAVKRRQSDTKIVTNFRPSLADAVKTLKAEIVRMAEDLG